MKPVGIGLIGFAILILYEIPFSRTIEHDSHSPDKVIIRPKMMLDYDFMRPGHVVKGRNVVIKCTYSLANETHPVEEYHFFFDRKPLETENKYNITIYGDSLIILNVNESHVGTYFCRIKDSGGMTQPPSVDFFLALVHQRPNHGTLEHQELPILRISSGEAGEHDIIFVSRFDNVSLSCFVMQNTKLIRRIYWLHDGEKIGSHNIDGADFFGVTLNLASIEMNQTGVYSCQADTSLGHIFSSFLELRVTNRFYNASTATSAIELTVNLGYEINPTNIQEFDEVYMTCEITPNTTSFNFLLWFHDESILWENIEKGIIYEGTKLILKHVTKMSSGLYSCIVDTDQGLLNSTNNMRIHVKDNMTAVLFVSQKFRELDIEKQCPRVWRLLQLPHIPRAQLKLGDGMEISDIVENDNIYFTCNVTPITAKVRQIKWFLNDEELFRNEDIEIYNHPPTIVFPCIKRKFAGNISCMAEIEGDTSPKSNNLTLEIHEPIKEGLKNCETRKPIAIVELLHHPKFIYINETAVWLHCHIHPKKYDHKIENIAWFYNGRQFTAPRHTTSISELTISDSELTSSYFSTSGRSLLIYRIKKKDIGNYQCKPLLKNNYLCNGVPASISDVTNQKMIPSWKRTPPPIVTTELLDNHNLYELAYIYFYCDVKPKTTLVRAVHWFRKLELLDDMVDDKITIRNHSLRLNLVKQNYSGDYFCLIETDGGTFRSEPTSLTFKRGMNIFLTGKVSVVAYLGDPSAENRQKDNIYFICDIFPPRTPILQLNWYHNDMRIFPNNSIIFNDRFLYLFNISKHARGRYRCEVETKKGFYRSLDINVTIKPGVRKNEKKSPFFPWPRIWWSFVVQE